MPAKYPQLWHKSTKQRSRTLGYDDLKQTAGSYPLALRKYHYILVPATRYIYIYIENIVDTGGAKTDTGVSFMILSNPKGFLQIGRTMHGFLAVSLTISSNISFVNCLKTKNSRHIWHVLSSSKPTKTEGWGLEKKKNLWYPCMYVYLS